MNPLDEERDLKKASLRTGASSIREDACRNNAQHGMPKITVYTNGMLVNSRFYDFSEPSGFELKSMLDRGEFDREVLGTCGRTAEVVIESRSECYVGCTTDDTKRSISSTIDNVKKLKIEDTSSLPMSVRFKYVIGRGKVPMDFPGGQENIEKGTNESQGVLGLPKEVCLGMPGTVRFKLVYATRTTTVLASEKVTVGDLVLYIREETGKAVALTRRGELLDSSELVLVLRNYMVDIIL